MFPEWMTKLSNGEAIHISDVSKIPDASTEKEMLVGQGIKSALVLPVLTGGKLIGFIGFDDIIEIQPRDDNDIALLRLSAEIIGNALEKKRASDQLARLNEELKSFNIQLETK